MDETLKPHAKYQADIFFRYFRQDSNASLLKHKSNFLTITAQWWWSGQVQW